MSPAKTYKDGSTFDGELNDKGEKEGIGKLIFKDRSNYRGEFKNGFCHGHGVMEIPENGFVNKYQGQFANGKFHGYGIFIQSDNMKYEGEFNEGKIQGLGRVTFPDKTGGIPCYEGTFKDGEIVERKLCPDAVEKAKKAAEVASKL